jgi:hypothetical protein
MAFQVSPGVSVTEKDLTNVVPAVSTEDAILKFPKGVQLVKPYLRYTPQPE